MHGAFSLPTTLEFILCEDQRHETRAQHRREALTVYGASTECAAWIVYEALTAHEASIGNEAWIEIEASTVYGALTVCEEWIVHEGMTVYEAVQTDAS